MSRELSDLKTSLQAAEAAVASDLELTHLPHGHAIAHAHGHSHALTTQAAAPPVPSFQSSEAAVQAILECLKNQEFTKAVRYIQESRWVGAGPRAGPRAHSAVNFRRRVVQWRFNEWLLVPKLLVSV